MQPYSPPLFLLVTSHKHRIFRYASFAHASELYPEKDDHDLMFPGRAHFRALDPEIVIVLSRKWRNVHLTAGSRPFDFTDHINEGYYATRPSIISLMTQLTATPLSPDSSLLHCGSIR